MRPCHIGRTKTAAVSIKKLRLVIRIIALVECAQRFSRRIPLGPQRLNQPVDFIADRRDCALADLHQFQPTHTGAGNKLLHSTIVAMNVVFKKFCPPDAEPAVLAIK